MRIMIVDDSSTFREALRVILKKNPDFEVVAEAEDGKKAIGLFDIYQPDIVLMDIEMPLMNGIEATKILSKKSKPPKIIAISAHAEMLYKKEALEAGFSGFVYKNDIFDQLTLEIEKLMF